MHVLYNILQPDNIDEAQINHWLQQLPAGKQKQLVALQQRSDLLRSLVAYQLLKSAIRQYGFNSFELETLSFNLRGKAELPLPLDLSISHSGDLAACVVSSSGPVGIDIEARQQPRRVRLPRYFSARELQLISTSTRKLSEYWCRKEAIVKAAGDEGLAAIHRVELHESQGRLDDESWYTFPLEIHVDYSVQLACRDPQPRIEIQALNPQESDLQDANGSL